MASVLLARQLKSNGKFGPHPWLRNSLRDGKLIAAAEEGGGGKIPSYKALGGILFAGDHLLSGERALGPNPGTTGSTVANGPAVL